MTTVDARAAARSRWARQTRGWQSPWLMPRIAIKDLRHEWVLTSTLVLAIGAVVAPLLLLLGLKYGVVEYQLTRLIENPSFREITPLKGEEIPPERIEEWRARDDVAFVTPGIALGASSVLVRGAGPELRMDVLPSLPGDPLLIENGAAAPAEGEVVLSFQAAQALIAAGSEEKDAAAESAENAAGNAAPAPAITPATLRADLVGREITVIVGRRNSGRREVAEVPLAVAGVADPRADPLDRIYAHFSLVEGIETYRSFLTSSPMGGAVEAPEAPLSFDSYLALAPEPVDSEIRRRLTNRTGVSAVQDITDFGALFGGESRLTPIEPGRALRLSAAEAALTPSNESAIRGRLRGAGAIRIPYVAPFAVSLEVDGAQKTLQAIGEPEASLMDAMGLTPLLIATGTGASDADGEPAIPVAAPESAGLPAGARSVMTVQRGGYALTLPVRVIATTPDDRLRLPVEVAAQLRTGAERRVFFDGASGTLRLDKQGYRGFRLYARSIYDVAALNQFFRAQGIEVVTQEGPIQQVAEMDRALTRLFLLVAVVGVTGAIAAMAASLIASVERKRAEIGMMRLLGFSRTAIFIFPIAQAAVVAFFATAFAVASFLALSEVINRVFAADLPLGERLCYLPANHLAWTFAITIAIAIASALLASQRATRIDPADAIRQE